VVDFPAPGAPISRGSSLSRRSLIAGAAGMAALVASGCSVDNPVADEKVPQTAAGLAPDVAVATQALTEIGAVRLAASRTLSRFPAARPQLAPLVKMHRAHEKSLADAVPDRAGTSASPPPYVVPGKRQAALTKLATREQGLHDSLGDLALRAQSGDFARLLASMGAATSQRLAVWTT
jgi:hypothetical protein